MKRVVLLLIALIGTPAMGETPEEVQQRLEEYRQRVRDTEIYLQQKKEREYAETWQRYGSTEVKRTSWRRQADGSWVTEAKFESEPAPAPAPEPLLRPSPDQLRSVPPPKRFDQSLDDLVREGVIKPWERNLMRSGGSSSQLRYVGPDQIGVSCTSLVVNTYRYGKWGTWQRPEAGDPYEQLVIDRCSMRP